MSQPTRILIVDDHPIVRCGLAQLISQHPELVLCGEAADTTEALEAVASLCPDLVIVDISLKGESGIDLIKQIKSRDRKVKILVCSMHEELYFAERVLHAGALGFVNKEQAMDKLLDAIFTVLQDKIYLSVQMSERLLHRSVGLSQLGENPIDCLSDRELEVLELIGEALTTGEIAEKLYLSRKTVETHRENIKAKLRLKNGAELMRWAVQWVLQKK